MDLIVKVLVIALVIVAALVALRYAVSSAPGSVSSLQAVANVTNYLRTNYPGSVVNITSVNVSQFSGSWHIVAAIITNSTSACPNYFAESFDYPKFGFVPTPQNNYTSGCIINGIESGQPYNITSYPVAMAEAYNTLVINLNTSRYNFTQVRDFISRYGYSNVLVLATYHNGTVSFGGKNYARVWLVTYSDPQASHSVEVGIAQLNGTPLYVTNGTA